MATRTEPPRDPSDMASNSHTGRWTAGAIAVVLVIGFLIYAQYNGGESNPGGGATTTTEQPKSP